MTSYNNSYYQEII